MSAERMKKGNHDFPADLFPEVLSRLPVKSLLRFRSVCKSWLALIHDPVFCRLHLNRFSNENHLLLYKWGKKKKLDVRCSKTLEITSWLDIPTDDMPCVLEMSSSVDGLCVLYGYRLNSEEFLEFLVLWNPSIQKHRSVPVESESFRNKSTMEWQLGFDWVSQDYKYVRLVQTESCSYISLYSVAKNSFKKIEIEKEEFNSVCKNCWKARQVCVKGVLYVFEKASYKLLSFDLSKESLDSAVLPDELRDNGVSRDYQVLTVADGGSSLAMFEHTGTKGVLWVCQSTEGDNKFLNWTKRYSFNCGLHEACNLYKPTLLYTKKNGEMLIHWVDSAVTSCHPETQEEKILLQNLHPQLGDGHSYLHIRSYAESLVLLH